MYGDAHGMGYLLDPRYLGDKMKRNLRKEVEDFIFKFPTEDGNMSTARRDQLAQEYMSFRIEQLGEREQDTFRFQMIGKSKTVLQWWKADGTDWPLLQNCRSCVFDGSSSSIGAELFNVRVRPLKASQLPWSRKGQEACVHQNKRHANVRYQGWPSRMLCRDRQR